MVWQKHRMQDYIEKQVKQNTSTMKMNRGMYCQTSNYIFILDLIPDFTIMHKDNCKMRWESFKFRDLVQLI